MNIIKKSIFIGYLVVILMINQTSSALAEENSDDLFEGVNILKPESKINNEAPTLLDLEANEIQPNEIKVNDEYLHSKTLEINDEKESEFEIEFPSLIAPEEDKSLTIEAAIEQEEVFSDQIEITLDEIKPELTKFQKFKGFIKGESARDTMMIGMWSKHFGTRNKYRETHNLFAAQYRSIFVGTFANSHSHQVFVVGVARTVAKKRLWDHLVLDAGYKVGPMYGYRKGIPHVARFSILPLICLGVSYYDIGVDLNIFPTTALSFNTHVNLDLIRNIKTKISKSEPESEESL